jgi:hypothetical protein
LMPPCHYADIADAADDIDIRHSWPAAARLHYFRRQLIMILHAIID